MPRIKYRRAPDICCIVEKILSQSQLPHIDGSKVRCVRSFGARTRAVARIHGLSMAWIASGLEPGYVIEVISERFDSLSFEDKVKTIIHELLHIPYTFSGGLRPHGKLVNSRRVNAIYKKLDMTKLNTCKNMMEENSDEVA